VRHEAEKNEIEALNETFGLNVTFKIVRKPDPPIGDPPIGGKKLIVFPDIEATKSAAGKMKTEVEEKQRKNLKNKFLGFKDNYYHGVTINKYIKDPEFERFLKSEMKNIDQY